MAKKVYSPNVVVLALAFVFVAIYFIPWDAPRVTTGILEGFQMLGEYAREHVLLCLVPAMFIAGAIGVFLNQQAVMKYLGPKAPKPVAYAVAAVSGAILAVCSCTVLPLFKGIYKKGAGIGPAISFLYSGPAISIIAITMSFQVFGWKIGLARTIGAITFAIVIGLCMQMIFRKEDEARLADERLFKAPLDEGGRKLWQTVVYIGSMVGFLIFINLSSSKGTSTLWDVIYRGKYIISGAFVLILLFAILKWFKRHEVAEWGAATRDFALQIVPLLFMGILVSGFLLGRPGQEGLIPNAWIAGLVGGNSVFANGIAAISGAFMYFATLTEVPIVQGLLGSGMGQGPALALLLAGPSLSLPSMLVIGGELGFKKTVVYVLLVLLMSTSAGVLFGSIVQ
ncbi:MAG: permease [Spirochaetales bacterium]|nr:permease [Spirochaetales bacterium]